MTPHPAVSVTSRKHVEELWYKNDLRTTCWILGEMSSPGQILFSRIISSKKIQFTARSNNYHFSYSNKSKQ